MPKPGKGIPRRLVLCFDGTGNKYTGDESDTNIIKIYEMLDRKCPGQYHYYQPGIGTYVQNQISNSSTGNVFTRIRSFFTTSIDSMIGTSFVHHVLSGYEFLMRFYQPGDKIYIFGFSRGAYTARFLSEMVSSIGLLSRGNEEMIRFAWQTFSAFQSNKSDDPRFRRFMNKFRDTFCREGVKVYFLGLFDCVNSVGQFELPLFRKSSPYIPIPPADHIRHAVSIHERRLKFKPALFIQNPENKPDTDIKEVWFAGGHADVGGGWNCNGMGHLLSDISLRWMIDEVLALPDNSNALAWQKTKVDHAEMHEQEFEDLLIQKKNKTQVLKGKGKPSTDMLHDCLAFGGCISRVGTLGWWVLEVLPFFTRLELNEETQVWEPRYWPPNMGASRDIPFGAEIHYTVQQLRRAGILGEKHMPKLGGVDGPVPSFHSIGKVFSWFSRRRAVPEFDAEEAPLMNELLNGYSEEMAENSDAFNSRDVMNDHWARTWRWD